MSELRNGSRAVVIKKGSSLFGGIGRVWYSHGTTWCWYQDDYAEQFDAEDLEPFETFTEEKMDDKTLTITREKMLEAANDCPTAKGVFKKLWPDEFGPEWVLIQSGELGVTMCGVPQYVYDKATSCVLWYLGDAHPHGTWVGPDKDIKFDGGRFYRRRK